MARTISTPFGPVPKVDWKKIREAKDTRKLVKFIVVQSHYYDGHAKLGLVSF